jgi:hypothetical protein
MLPCLLPHPVSRFRLFSFAKYLLSASSNFTSKYCTRMLQVSEFARGFDSLLLRSHIWRTVPRWRCNWRNKKSQDLLGFPVPLAWHALLTSLNMFRIFGDQSRSDDGGDAMLELGQRIVYCYTVDKYFHLLLIAFKTISVVQLRYLDFNYWKQYRQFTLKVTQTHSQINQTSIDRSWHLNTLSELSLRGTDWDTDHYPGVANGRVKLAVSKQAARMFDVERFNLKKLCGLVVRQR